MTLERPNYIPLERDVRDKVKKAKGILTYSEFLKKTLEKNNFND